MSVLSNSVAKSLQATTLVVGHVSKRLLALINQVPSTKFNNPLGTSPSRAVVPFLGEPPCFNIC